MRYLKHVFVIKFVFLLLLAMSHSASAQTTYLDRVIVYADTMLLYGTDRYGTITSPQFTTALTRDAIPELVVATGKEAAWPPRFTLVPNVFIGSDYGHKVTIRGGDVDTDGDLYHLLYLLSEITGDPKYTDAADASLTYFLDNTPDAVTGLFPVGEHTGWDFRDENRIDSPYIWKVDGDYDDKHEFQGDWNLYDKYSQLATAGNSVLEGFANGIWTQHVWIIASGPDIGRLRYSRHGEYGVLGSALAQIDKGGYPRHGGYFVDTMSAAYEYSVNIDFRADQVSRIDAFVTEWELQFLEFGYIVWDMASNDLTNKQNDKLAKSLRETAPRLAIDEPALAARITALADNIWPLETAYDLADSFMTTGISDRDLGKNTGHFDKSGYNIGWDLPGKVPAQYAEAINKLVDAAKEDLSPTYSRAQFFARAEVFATEAIDLFLEDGTGSPLPRMLDKNSPILLVDGVTVVPAFYHSYTGGAELMYALLRLHVAAPPVWDSDPLAKDDARENIEYSGSLDTDDVFDPKGGSLTFTDYVGPGWLTIDPDGTLSGEPAQSDVGPNSWDVTVEDSEGVSATAVVTIRVLSVSDFDADGDVDRFDLEQWNINFGLTVDDQLFDGSSFLLWQQNYNGPTLGISVTPNSGLVTTEAGGADTFTVVLDGQPSADVNIGISSSDTLEGTVAPASLTFTSANWFTPQTVTVTGVDDLEIDGPILYTIVTAAATSSDPGYNSLDAADVSVTNIDNETPGILVTPSSGLVTTVAGGEDTFTVVLFTQPSANVNIGTGSLNPNEGTAAPASLTFTSTNWFTAQTVTVTGVSNASTVGDVLYEIGVWTTSSDPIYNGLFQPVWVTNATVAVGTQSLAVGTQSFAVGTQSLDSATADIKHYAGVAAAETDSPALRVSRPLTASAWERSPSATGRSSLRLLIIKSKLHLASKEVRQGKTRRAQRHLQELLDELSDMLSDTADTDPHRKRTEQLVESVKQQLAKLSGG